MNKNKTVKHEFQDFFDFVKFNLLCVRLSAVSSLHWLILVLFYALFIPKNSWKKTFLWAESGIESSNVGIHTLVHTTVYEIKQNVKSQTKKVGSFWHCLNILQWGKNDFKSMIYTNGDNYLNSGPAFKWWSYVRYSYPHCTLKHNFCLSCKWELLQLPGCMFHIKDIDFWE